MVKSQAKTVVLLLRVRSPNNHVTPSRGSRMSAAFRSFLWCIYAVHSMFKKKRGRNAKLRQATHRVTVLTLLA